MRTSNPAAPINPVNRIGLLAGSGRLPPLLVHSMASKGVKPFVINLTRDADSWISTVEHATIPVTQLSSLIKSLQMANVSTVVLAGGISDRPRIFDFLLDWRMYAELPRLYRALRRGDDGLLRAAIDLLERSGFNVIGAHEIAPSLLATEAVLTERKPASIDLRDIELGIKAAIEHGRLDLGQAVVTRSGQEIARETRAGTAAMLTSLASDARQASSGVLVKWSKPGQELRVDLPSIGPDTIIQAKAAGLSGIVVEAGRSLILDRHEVIKLADENGLFVAGMRHHL